MTDETNQSAPWQNITPMTAEEAALGKVLALADDIEHAGPDGQVWLTNRDRDLIAAALRAQSAELAEWKQAASVEAQLRREAHAEIERLRAQSEEWISIIRFALDGVGITRALRAQSGEREALIFACARLQSFLDTFGDLGDCVTQADIDDWRTLAQGVKP